VTRSLYGDIVAQVNAMVEFAAGPPSIALIPGKLARRGFMDRCRTAVALPLQYSAKERTEHMLKTLLIVCGLCLAVSLPAWAQEPATLVLRSGERISGELVDHGGVGFTMRVNGANRQVPTGEVAVVEFAGGDLTAEQRAKVQAGQPIVVLRSGQVIDGRLADISGTRPLKIIVDTPSGQRDFASNDVARVYYAVPGGAAVATTGQAAPAAGSQTVNVDAKQPWTDAGMAVRRGDRVAFTATGDIDIMSGAGMSAGPAGTTAVSAGRYPVQGAPAGALIGRIGNGRPFLIGSNTQPITMTDNGRLFVGVNDNAFDDNSGSFSVSIHNQGR
jgi:hypothetical protein